MLAHKSDRHCKLLSLRDLRAGPGDPKKQEHRVGDHSVIAVSTVHMASWSRLLNG